MWFCPGAVVHHRVDRRSVTPRRIASTAFTRGRIAGLKQPIPPGRNLRGFPALANALARWSFSSLSFRLAPRGTSFEGVRHAAFAAGFALDALRAGRPARWQSLAAGRITFPIRGLILRLTQDTP